MAIIKEQIPVHKHFLMIDSPVEFDLIANNGTDIVHRPAGAWRVDLYTLLPEKYFKQYPVFVLEIEYDDTNLGGKSVIVRESDIDLGTGIAGVNGQEVYITNLADIENYIPKKKIRKFNLLNNDDKVEFCKWLNNNGVDTQGAKRYRLDINNDIYFINFGKNASNKVDGGKLFTEVNANSSTTQYLTLRYLEFNCNFNLTDITKVYFYFRKYNDTIVDYNLDIDNTLILANIYVGIYE